MDDRELEEQLLPKLVQVHGEPIDPNLLAAYADGALSEEEHAEVGRRIAADPDALLLVNALQEDRSRATTRNWSLVALAASVLIAVGVWSIDWSGNREPLDLDSRLARAVATLSDTDGSAFADFNLVGAEEMRAQPAVTRGGPQWLGPLGLLLDAPSELRWRNPPGATRVEIQVLATGFRWKRQVEGEHHAAPELAPGSYVVTLRALDALAGQKIRRAFEIVTLERRATLERALATIRAKTADDLEDLVVAHYLLRNRLYADAATAARSAQAQSGRVSEAATALLEHVEAVALSR